MAKQVEQSEAAKLRIRREDCDRVKHDSLFTDWKVGITLSTTLSSLAKGTLPWNQVNSSLAVQPEVASPDQLRVPLPWNLIQRA